MRSFLSLVSLAQLFSLQPIGWHSLLLAESAVPKYIRKRTPVTFTTEVWFFSFIVGLLSKVGRNTKYIRSSSFTQWNAGFWHLSTGIIVWQPHPVLILLYSILVELLEELQLEDKLKTSFLFSYLFLNVLSDYQYCIDVSYCIQSLDCDVSQPSQNQWVWTKKSIPKVGKVGNP